VATLHSTRVARRRRAGVPLRFVPVSITDRIRGSAAAASTARLATSARSRAWSWGDGLFAVAMGLVLAAHAVFFFAVLAIAPVTPAEQLSLDLLHLPVDVARLATLPFDAVLLGSLFVLGRRVAGRWGGWAAIFAVLSVDLRADAPFAIVYGPSVATGGWMAGALLAAALAVVARHRLVAAALLGVAAVASAPVALALPAFLVAFALFPGETGTGIRARLVEASRFTGVWALPFAAGQALWLLDTGAEGYAARMNVVLQEFQPHALVPFLEQQRLVFSSWHFDFVATLELAAFLFIAAAIGVARYFLVPRPEETGPVLLALVRRMPLELWAAGITATAFSISWALSGSTAVIEPNLPALVAVLPLLTALAYRGAKFTLRVNRFWAFLATLYLVGLVIARSVQLVLTLVEAFQA
jgi:hypothetical protein